VRFLPARNIAPGRTEAGTQDVASRI